MATTVQILAILIAFAAGFAFLVALGRTKTHLLFSREEKTAWDVTVAGSLGGWMVTTNIVGTLTSLATVYLFFIGNAKLFGWWTFFAPVTLFFGYWVTNKVTSAICSNPDVKKLLQNHEQQGAVIASLFWDSSSSGKTAAKLVKAISLLSIGGVVWLEFSLFADITARVLGWGLEGSLTILGLSTLSVVYFTLRYGIQGIVFVDLFEAPLILIGSIVLAIGCAIAVLHPSSAITLPSVGEMFSPMLPIEICVLFVIHVLALNLLIILVTEPHWLRVWAFGARETTKLPSSLLWTACISVLLIFLGIVAFYLSGGKPGEDSIVSMIKATSEISLVFPVAFWVAGVAALFSTADAQIYSFLVVRQYDTQKGTLENRSLDSIRPLAVAVAATVIFVALYAFVRSLSLPFEKIIFVIVPLCLCIMPAFSFAMRRTTQRPSFLVVAVVVYGVLSTLGLLQPEHSLQWNIAAAVGPISLALVAYMWPTSRITKG